MVLKERDLVLERVDKALSSQFWSDVNLRSGLYSPTLRCEVQDLRVASPPCPQRPPLAVALKGDFRAASVGDSFGPSWATHWFTFTAAIPKDDRWKGKEVRLLWDSNSEAMLYIDNKAVQAFAGTGGDDRRTDYILTKSAVPGESWVCAMEMACNGPFGLGEGDCIQPPNPNRTFKLAKAEVVVSNPKAWSVFWDVTVLRGISKALPETHPISRRALVAANGALNAWQRGQREEGGGEDAMDIAKRQVLGHKNGGSAAEPGDSLQHVVYAVGHCHIDTAWLWPYAETRRKVGRSWATTLQLMHEYPNYRFCASQAVQFHWLKEDVPELYNRILSRVQEGRFIPVGGSWVEFDANLPSGESLVRQMIHGQRFFKQEFGFHATEFWLPDTFGYCAQLPQLLRGSGISRFLTQKLSWCLINAFPHSTFYWEGLDGSTVLTHFPPADTYVSSGSAEEVVKSAWNHKNSGQSSSSMMLFGHGDGGGGPDRSHLEQLTRLQDVRGCPKVVIASPSEFFSAVEEEEARQAKDRGGLPVWTGELYLELHQGTLTSQAWIKASNRRAEGLLHDNDAALGIITSTTTTSNKRVEDAQKQMEELWKLVLLNQFHDVIPGSSIGLVYDDAREHLGRVHSEGSALLASLLPTIIPPPPTTAATGGDVVALVNLTPFPRHSSLAPLLPPEPNGHHHHGGGGDGGGGLVVPAYGYTYAYRKINNKEGEEGENNNSDQASVSLDKEGDGVVLQNRRLRATISSTTGRLTSLVLLRSGGGGGGREFIDASPTSAAGGKGAGGKGGNDLVLYEDVPLYWDAWDIMPFALEQGVPLPGVSRAVEYGEGTGGEAWVKLGWDSVGEKSSLEQEVVLGGGEAGVLEFRTKVTWAENRQLLKVEFPVCVRSAHALYETQFGCLHRPTHQNTSHDGAKWEVCGHRYMDLSETGAGIALLNDSKYGHVCRGSRMALSLLRAPKAPDAECDMGVQEFRYGLFPHWGGPHDHHAQVLREAWHFNAPLHTINLPNNNNHNNTAGTTAAPSSFVVIEHDDHDDDDEQAGGAVGSHGVVLDTIKVCEEGPGEGVVLRLYEACGGRGRVRVRLGPQARPVRGWFLTNLLEEEEEAVALEGDNGSVVVDVTPFQIVTLKAVFQQ